ncbi:Beta-galactosidase precursor [compost metagenome]
MYGFPFSSINNFAAKATATGKSGNGPTVQKGSFTINTVADTYLDMTDWGKGVVWINGHNLGKYWAIGPQQTLYVPKEWLKKGKNEVAVLELLKTDQQILKTIDQPILNTLKKLNVD